MQLFNVLLVSLLLSSCAAFSTKEATIGCQGADVVTTAIALNSGAVETNPIMAGVISALGIPGLILAKLGITYLLLHTDNKEVVGGVNAATCGVAIHNMML